MPTREFQFWKRMKKVEHKISRRAFTMCQNTKN